MQVEVLSRVTDELREQWQQLFRCDPGATPFCSPAWVLGYWRHFGRGEQPWIISARERGHLVGIATLAMRRVRGIRRLEPLARIGDYWDVLALPAQRLEFLDAMVSLLQRRNEDWDELSLRRLPHTSTTGEVLRRAGVAASCTSSPYPGVQLPGTFDEYLMTLERKRRADLRRQLRKLDRNEVRLEPVVDPDALRDAAERFHRLRQRQWATQNRKLDSYQTEDRFRELIGDVVLDLVPQGRAMLWELYAASQLVGSFVFFIDEKTCYGYLYGYTPAAANLGIGNIGIAAAIRDSIEKEREYFDFMMGTELYKYRVFGATDRWVQQWTVRAPRPRALLSIADGALLGVARSSKHAVRRLAPRGWSDAAGRRPSATAARDATSVDVNRGSRRGPGERIEQHATNRPRPPVSPTAAEGR